MNLSSKPPILTITRDDCEWRYQVGRGNGGQKKQKTSSAVICFHRPSEAEGYAEDTRSQLQNRSIAFKRMFESIKFQNWLKLETMRLVGDLDNIDKIVNRAMSPSNLLVEVQCNGKWIKATKELMEE